MRDWSRSIRRVRRSPLAVGRAVLSGTALLLVIAGGIPALAALDGAAVVVARAQLIPALLRLRGLLLVGGGTALFVFPALAVLTAIVGRGYCSSLCPLGTLQDATFAVSSRLAGVRLRFRPPRSALRAATIAILVAAFAAGSVIPLSLLEPFSIVSRVIGLAAGAFTPAHGPSQPLDNARELATSSSLIAAVAVLSTAVLLSVLAASAVRGRLFCNTLCPAGTLLSLPGRYSLLRIRMERDRCTACGRCERICPARCIDVSSARIYAGSCTLCFSCIEVCPSAALRYGARREPR